MKHAEYINGAFHFQLDTNGLNPCNSLSLEYQNAHFLMPAPKDEPWAFQQGFILVSG